MSFQRGSPVTFSVTRFKCLWTFPWILTESCTSERLAVQGDGKAIVLLDQDQEFAL